MPEDTNGQKSGTGSDDIDIDRRSLMQSAQKTEEHSISDSRSGRPTSTKRRSVLSGIAALSVGSLSAGITSASAPPADEVPSPELEGPITGGIRTGEPQTASLVDVSEYGYVEEEYFISGTARALTEDSDPADYTTRFLVYRPEHRSEFNGTVIVNWMNVTAQYDVPSL